MTTYFLPTGQTLEIPTTAKDSQGNEFSINQKVWESGDKKRVYLTASFQRGGSVNCGYIDLKTGKEYLESNPRGVAKSVSNAIPAAK